MMFPFGAQPEEVSRENQPDTTGEPHRLLRAALADPDLDSGFLALAEEAVRAQPGDGHILLLAATAALLDEDAARAQVFLKRFRKRFVEIDACHLLNALALAHEKRLAPAQSLLEAHGLADWFNALRVFPGGIARRAWLSRQYARIFERDTRVPSKRVAPGPVRKAKSPAKSPAKISTKTPTRPKPAAEAPIAPIRPPPLPRIEIDIPFSAEFDFQPLLDAIEQPPNSDGAWHRLRERFAHLALAQGFDELLCLPHLRGIETFWYQVETVRKVLKQHRGRVLLGDEVGLGKTIEAGMILKEYLLRGIVNSVLVLTPASLVGQWQEELETKFDIACATTHDALLRSDPERFWSQDRLVASLALARRSEHAAHILGRSFDLVIVDEAHHLRDRTSQGYKLVDALNKRFVLLLSATPVQNDLTELYNLLTLLKPGIFKTLKEFRAAYMTAGKPRQPANAERLRELMRGAMVRNTRAVVALKLPRRHAVTICADGSDGEPAAYRELEAAVRRLAAEGVNRLALRHLLAAAGSSPAAAAAAVRRLSGRHVDTAWQALAKKWAAIGVGGKEAALIDLLRRNPGEKKLIFVHYRETLEHLAALLAREGFAFARFEGALSGPAKDAAVAEFRERVPVLLCTESGGEGRNLQFCNTVINFDVPWNPMAIEQRIGRIDRIGQQREVFVFNLVTRGTLEQQILALLDEKISMFELVVGEVGAILGGLDEDRDFADLMLDAWLHTTETGRAEALEELGRRLQGAREHHEDAKALDTALFGDDFETA
ncbi:SNF2-related protein [Bradyrhizobium sp.]|uniref:DEAD/DEAH box helicase n=1 Tax=Bradyrhizobium sp. TaxID=376 RepID=UPI001EB3FC96|nr:SNF2-related protein [Bradyrhizobium sp.]MBV9979955.1 DEAD/DEAH box helicase family protein [Bradyrhizobium sp.]